MNLVKKESKLFFCCLESSDKLIEMGLYPVMFGFRVRAGFIGNPFVEIDWCGGSDQKQVEYLYSAMHSILLKRNSDKDAFQGLRPYSEIKPFYNDVDFIAWLSKTAGEFDIIKLPNLSEIRESHLNSLLLP